MTTAVLDSFYRAIFDGLAHQAAVLDETARIVVVNQAWDTFAKANGGAANTPWRERSYLDVCATSAESGDADAKQVHAGLESVLSGHARAFDFEYPCHSPTEQRWFMMQVRRMDWPGPKRLIVMHQNITARVLAEQRAQELAVSDGLTGLANRRAFDQFLDEGWRRAQRHKLDIALIMMDIDCFKQLNDNYGHSRGDQCLQDVAGVMAQFANRPDDLVARYGGEEFVAVLVGTDAQGAKQLAEQMRAAVEQLALPHAHSAAGPVLTLSAGVASLRPGQSDSASALVDAADQALYAAKAAGRNQVAVHGEAHDVAPTRLRVLGA